MTQLFHFSIDKGLT